MSGAFLRAAWRIFTGHPAEPTTRPAMETVIPPCSDLSAGASSTQAIKADGFIATPAENLAVVYLPGTGRGYFLEVKGESHYQETLGEQWLKMRPDREMSVRLTAEPSNVHDPNAVAVQTHAGETVGYLPREEAARYQQLLLQINAQGLIGLCTAKLVGGTARKKSIGIFLDVEPPTIVASKLGLSYKRVVMADAKRAPGTS